MTQLTDDRRPARLAVPARPAILARVLDPATGAGDVPVFDPQRWTGRHTRWLRIAIVLALFAGLFQATQSGAATGGEEGLRAFLAAAFGLGIIGFALSLPGFTVPGFIAGGFFIAAGVLSWSYTNHPVVVWTVLAIEGVIFAIWSAPWIRDLTKLPKLGTAWIGLAYWYFGIIGAVLVLHTTVAAERIAYAGVFTLAVLAVITATRRSGRDLSVGMVSAFLVALGLLFLVGSGNAFNDIHAVPNNAWGAHQEYRFWGGPGVLYHPNSIAVIIVMIAIRIAVDRSFRVWQRYTILGVSTVILLLVNSRTGWGYLGAGAAIYAFLVWRQRRQVSRTGTARDNGMTIYPDNRSAWKAAVAGFVVVGVIAIGSGGMSFLLTQRYSSSAATSANQDAAAAAAADISSGRTATWLQAWHDFKVGPLASKIFGDASNARGTVSRTNTGTDAAKRPKLTTDNALVASLRSGGILGGLTFLIGLVLLVWHGVRSVFGRDGPGGAPVPAWFTVMAVGSVVTIATANWLLSSTGAAPWILLVAGEVYLMLRPQVAPATPVAPAQAGPQTTAPVSGPVPQPATSGMTGAGMAGMTGGTAPAAAGRGAGPATTN